MELYTHTLAVSKHSYPERIRKITFEHTIHLYSWMLSLETSRLSNLLKCTTAGLQPGIKDLTYKPSSLAVHYAAALLLIINRLRLQLVLVPTEHLFFSLYSASLDQHYKSPHPVGHSVCRHLLQPCATPPDFAN